MRLLIANGANGHLTDSDGRTALHRAAQNGDAKLCLAVVLAYPELKTVGDNSGKVPADYATESDLILILTTTTH